MSCYDEDMEAGINPREADSATIADRPRGNRRKLLAMGLHVARWTLTVSTLLILAIGSLYASACAAAGDWAVLFGWVAWLLTISLVAVLGTMALWTVGRFLESIGYVVGSLVLNFAWFWAQYGLSTVAPVLVIPLALALNCAYVYLAWRFVLSGRARQPNQVAEPIVTTS